MYRVLRLIALILFNICFRIKIVGLENIPDRAGILVANHVSMLDPVMLGIAVKRPVHFMAKAELFKNRLSAWFFGQLHAFPVHRGTADTSAIRTALQILRDNKLLGIFPEGTRNKGEELLPFHSGAAMLAQRTQSPIVPVLIRGTEKLRFRQKIEVLVGRPIQPKEGKKATKEELAEINNLIFEQFTRLNRQEFKA